jgi:hypothetical protein
VQGDLFGVHDLFAATDEPVAVSVLILVVDQHSWVHSGRLVLVQVAAFPALLRHDSLCRVVHIVDRSFERLSVLEVEGSEHGVGTQGSLIDQQIMEIPETELGFSDRLGLGVKDVIVLDDSEFLVLLIIGLVADADEHKAVLGGFPHGVDSDLGCSHAVIQSDLLLERVHL